MTFVEPLDLQRILINNLAGSVDLFAFLGFIALGVLTAFMRVRGEISLFLFVVLAVLITPGLTSPYYIIILVVTGLIIMSGIKNIITRN